MADKKPKALTAAAIFDVAEDKLVCVEVPEWGGQTVDFRSEEDAWFDGEKVRFLDGRQTELTLIPSE